MKEESITLFERIGHGRENGVKRPPNPDTDRRLRKMIESSNAAGDCIICGKYGYYRPDVSRPDEIKEAERILASELHRARAILKKRLGMSKALKEWRESQCLLTAGEKEQLGKGSLQRSSEDMAIAVEEGSSIPGQMVMRMW